MSKRWLTLVTIGALISISMSNAAAAPLSAPGLQELRYIVVLKEDVQRPQDIAADHSRRFRARVEHVYTNALKGYSAVLSPAVVGQLKADPRVDFVELDQIASAASTQTSATWGLDRIDQRTLPLNGTFSYTNTGASVPVYVLDSGIRLTHAEFGGRATSGPDFIDNDLDASDCNGHGTHVAGTIGGTTYGVAKNAPLIAVRVLDCDGNGSWSQIIKGIDWVTEQHTGASPAVANMSIIGGASSAVDLAVSNSIADGITYVLAAGNNASDACRFSPARVKTALTIGASTRTDSKASFSNKGTCIDWYAPGMEITSASFLDDTSTATFNGTSMAAPHTAGAAALYLQSYPSTSPAGVATALLANTTKSVVKDGSGRKPLLFTPLSY